LSQSYNNATGQFAKGQINNNTMIAITDSYQPKYQSLINEAKALQPPKQFQNATDLYTRSLDSELQSNTHFRNYLAINNSTENKLSSKLLIHSTTRLRSMKNVQGHLPTGRTLVSAFIIQVKLSISIRSSIHVTEHGVPIPDQLARTS